MKVCQCHAICLSLAYTYLADCLPGWLLLLRDMAFRERGEIWKVPRPQKTARGTFSNSESLFSFCCLFSDPCSDVEHINYILRLAVRLSVPMHFTYVVSDKCLSLSLSEQVQWVLPYVNPMGNFKKTRGDNNTSWASRECSLHLSTYVIDISCTALCMEQSRRPYVRIVVQYTKMQV